LPREAPVLGPIDWRTLLTDPQERATVEERIDEYQMWWDQRCEQVFAYHLWFQVPPSLDRKAKLTATAGPVFPPSGAFVAWIRVPPGFKVLEGDVVGWADVGPVKPEDLDAIPRDEVWQHIEELQTKATVTLGLEVVAQKTGVHVFRIYVVGQTTTGVTTAGYRDFWVKVLDDTAYVSRSPSFYKWPGSGGTAIPGSPPEDEVPAPHSRNHHHSDGSPSFP